MPEQVQNQYPAVPWDEMRRMRDVVVRAYFSVDLPTIWQTIKEDLPPLKTQLDEVLGQYQ